MEKAIGIDLGTTYSVISTIDEAGRPIVLKNELDSNLTPSVIYFGEDGGILVGLEAKDMQNIDGLNVAMFFKRNMGNEDFFQQFNRKQYSATDMSAILLGKLKETAEKALNTRIEKAVITVPAYFNDLQRNETIKAASMAGLEVLRIINEPTAAAITFGIDKKCGKILVYDLGGGTFDVTVLEIKEENIKVLSTGGDHNLGGKDWDDAIVEYLNQLFSDEFGESPIEDMETYNDLIYQAEMMKKKLSGLLSISTTISYNGNRGKFELTRDHFEQLTKNLLLRTTTITNSILNESGLTWNDLTGVLLVGGSTKMPMVSDWVKEMSGKSPLQGINVDEAVATGAAIQAYHELEKSNPIYKISGSQQQYRIGGIKRVEDVMSHSLGLVALNADANKYINSIMIPKNVTIPIAKSKPHGFKTTAKGENELEVYLTQGESEDLRKCIVVGKYLFKNIRHVGDGSTTVDIKYKYNENGVVDLEATQEGFNPLTVEKMPLPDDLSWIFEPPVLKMVAPPMAVAISIDLSGSMEGKPLKEAVKAANEFVNNIDLSNSSVGFIAFANKSKVMLPLCQNEKSVRNAINDYFKIYDKGEVGYGNSLHPFDDAINILKKHDGSKFLIVLTDGYWSNPEKALERARDCANYEIEIIAVGFGGVKKDFLNKLATSDENALLTTQGDLSASFGNIAQVLTQNAGTGNQLKFKI